MYYNQQAGECCLVTQNRRQQLRRSLYNYIILPMKWQFLGL